MKPDRIVLDANVFISLVLGKKLDELVKWHKDEDLDIYVCRDLIGEVEDVLNRDKVKQYLTEPVSEYLRFIRSVTKETTIDKRFDRAPDLKDNYLFDLAYTVKSFYIVTGDRPLLNMKQANRIKIISIADFRKLLRAA